MSDYASDSLYMVKKGLVHFFDSSRVWPSEEGNIVIMADGADILVEDMGLGYPVKVTVEDSEKVVEEFEVTWNSDYLKMARHIMYQIPRDLVTEDALSRLYSPNISYSAANNI